MKRFSHRQRGFSLVSTMVGLTVGLMVATTAMSTAAFLEAQKRLAMGGNSVLVNGALGLGRMENEVRMAGLGMLSGQDFACASVNLAYKGTVRLDGAALYPAVIVDGGLDADTVSVAYLDSLTSATYAQLLLPVTSSAGDVKVALAPDATVGSALLLQDTGGTTPCTMRSVTAKTTSDFGTTLATGGVYDGGAFTVAGNYATGAHVNISRRFVWSTFRVKNNTLEEVDNLSQEATVIADGVIGMKAQYGITDAITTPPPVIKPATVSSWVSATDTFATPTHSTMARVRALRMGVVVRSMEKNPACAGKVSTLHYWPGGPTLDVSGATDWQCYSYRSFNLVVPLANVVMGLK